MTSLGCRPTVDPILHVLQEKLRNRRNRDTWNIYAQVNNRVCFSLLFLVAHTCPCLLGPYIKFGP